MPDPRLVSRAQRAATMLERAWDRWRAAHGLAAEPLPPVSSYVGYSIEEPWGRPRVVFGVDAADAEKLATLLQDCAAPPQPATPEAGVRIPAQGRTADLNGPREHHSAAPEPSGTGLAASGTNPEPSGAEQSSRSASGAHPVEATARPEDPADADDVQRDGSTDSALRSNGASADGASADGADESADADGRNLGESAARLGQDVSDNGDARNAGQAVTHAMVAELAGWAAGELPGQASARLAAWAAVGGTTARKAVDTDLRSSNGAADATT